MKEMKKEPIYYPISFHLDDNKDIYKETPIKEIKEELSDSDLENIERLATDQEQAIDDVSFELLPKECPFKQDFFRVSKMEEMKKEPIYYPISFHLDDNKDIYKETPIKEIKEELSDSDLENIERLATDQEQAIDDVSFELLPKECPFKQNFGEISLKEEVSEEFLHAETSSYPDLNGWCTKPENTLPNTSCLFTKPDSSQEKELNMCLPNKSKDILQSGNISSPTQAPKYDQNLTTSVYSKSDVPRTCPQNNLLPSQSTHTDSGALRHSRVNRKIYKCSSCPYQTAYKGALSIHLRTHSCEMPFKCNLCPYKAASKGQLKKHSYNHTDKHPFKCNLCPYQAAKKSQFKSHLYTHVGEKPFKCTLCPYQAAQKDRLKRHLHTHTCKKPFKCDICPYQASKKSDIKKHSLTHTGKKPLKCSLCPYQAAKKECLKRHLYTHTSEKPFKCSLCPYQAARKEHIKFHSYSHTGEKPFKCSLCPYQTACRTNLKRHSYTHTCDKPFKCDLCPYQSASKNHLKSHSYTHTGEKPFKCDICPYQAANKIHLKSHSYTHSGEKPFKCSLCPYEGHRKDYLIVHLRTHSGDKA